MACEIKLKTIDDKEYSVTQWPPTKAMVNKFKLTKICGPAIAKLVSGIGASNDDQLSALTGSISALFENAEPEDVVKLIESFIIDNVSVDGEKITFSKYTEMFSGDNLFDVYPIFFFVLSANYPKILGGKKFDALTEKAQQLL